ncbi:MAG: MFS transporter [Sandaracinaceae bacterium]
MARSTVDVPFAPRRFPFFYGWWILVVSTIGVIMSIPGQTMGVSVFTDDLLAATGLSRVALANAYLAGTVASGLTLPFGGRLLDRFGARATASVAAVALGATLLYLSVVDQLAPRGSLLALAWLIVGFFALRLSGQGMLTMVSRTMLGRWFEARRGLAAGISSVFVGFGFGVAPLVLDLAIEGAGWRGAWRGMAVVVALGMGGLALLFYRDRPEECGLEMDGAPSSPERTAARAGETSLTREQALRSLRFWAVTFALSVQALVVTGVTFHVVDLGAHGGLSRAESVAIFLPMSVVSTLTALLGGWLGDRLRIRTLLFAMMLAQAGGVVACVQLDTLYPLAALGLGVSGGLFGPIATIAFPRFFGRAHLGAIAGVEMMCVVLGSAVGPAALALGESMSGGYAWPLYMCLALPVAALGLTLAMREPRPI